MRFTALGSLASVIRVERLTLLRFAVATAVGSALPVFAILLMHQFLAGVLGEGEGARVAVVLARSFGTSTAIWILAALLLATFLASAAVAFHNEVLQQRLIRTIELHVMERLVRHLLTLSVLVLERKSQGDLLEAVREDVMKLRLVIVSTASLLLATLTAAGLIAVAVWLSPALAASSFPLLLVAAVPAMIVALRVRRRASDARRGAYRVFDVILQMLRGIRVIKVYRGEQAEAVRAVEQMRHYFSELIEIARTQALGRVALESLGGFSLVIVVIIGGFQVMDGRLSWPSLLAFLMAMRAAQGPLFEMNSQFLQIQRNLPAVQRLDELLSEQPTPHDDPHALPFKGPLRSVAFDRVSFCYQPAVAALRDASFEVSRGEVLGIVGPSAAGKTTLLNLTARFFDPTAGAVLINGRDAKTYRLADVHSQVAIVTQDPFLFSTTIRENIRCGRPGASDADVETAAQAAEIHDDILTLPEGYETLVGTGNRGLSSGQVQRLNVARAILKNAPLLLLDEATSSLDSIAEARVQRAITRLMHGRTTLVIAHRLSTLRNATKILVLDRGRIVNLGTHDELLVRCPLYRRMWNAQMRKQARPSARMPALAVKSERTH